MSKPNAPFDLTTLEFVKPAAAPAGDAAKPGEEKPGEDEGKKEEVKDDESGKEPKTEEKKEGGEEKPSEEKKEGDAEENKDGDDASKKEEKKEPESGKKKEPESGKKKESETDKVPLIDEELTKKYGIKDKKGLIDVLETVSYATEEIKKLEKELAEKKPEFESEQQEKAFNFIKDLDPSKWGDGIQTLGRLWTMEVDKEDGKIAMEEAFILDHPELTRDEAQKKFSRDFNRKYGDPNPDDYKDDAELKEEKEMRAIDRKTAESKARKLLKAKQEEFKAKPKTEKQEAPKQPEVVTKAIEKNEKSFADVIDKCELVFAPTDNEDDEFTVNFTEDQMKDIRAVCLNFIKNPGIYNEKGEFVEKDLTPEKLFERVAYFRYGSEIVEKNYKHAEEVFSIKRAEEIGTKKPTRQPKVNGSIKPSMTEEEQLEALIKARKEKAKNKRPAMA